MAKQELGSPFLLNLGLSIQQQNSYPTEENYPSKFSPNALNEWKESLIFSKNLSPVEAWGKVIGEFFKKCSDNNKFPFSVSRENTNSQVVELLSSKRAQAIAKLDNLIESIKNPHNSKVEINFPDTLGFNLRNTVECYFEKQDREDPTFLEDFAQKNDFVKSYEGYNLTLNDGVILTLEPVSNNRIRIGYCISIPLLPFLPDPIPSKTSLKRFIYDIILEPMLKMNPCKIFSQL